MLLSQIILKVYRITVPVYANIRKKYIKSLPPSLTAKSKLLEKIRVAANASKFTKEITQEIQHAYENKKELESYINESKLGFLLSIMEKTKNLEGDIIELGTYKGGTTVLLAKHLLKNNISKKIYTCDTFSGFPYADRFSAENVLQSSGNSAKKADLFKDTSLEYVKTKFEKFEVSKKIIIVQGLFESTLPTLTNHKFSLVMVDSDLYDSSKVAIEQIFPKMVKGGIMVFDDYDEENKDSPKWGQTKAVDDFVRINKLTLFFDEMPYIIKN